MPSRPATAVPRNSHKKNPATCNLAIHPRLSLCGERGEGTVDFRVVSLVSTAGWVMALSTLNSQPTTPTKMKNALLFDCRLLGSGNITGKTRTQEIIETRTKTMAHREYTVYVLVRYRYTCTLYQCSSCNTIQYRIIPSQVSQVGTRVPTRVP